MRSCLSGGAQVASMTDTPHRIRALNKENTQLTFCKGSGLSSSAVQKQRDGFEQQLKLLDDTGDAVQVWCKYTSWAATVCSDEEVAALLERACLALSHQSKYYADPRYLRLWVRLANTLPAPREVFEYLEVRGIGLQQALLYEAWAAVLEKQHAFPAAEAVYQSGLARGARPVARLQESCAAFQRRSKKRLAREDVSVEEMRARHVWSTTDAGHWANSPDTVDCGVWRAVGAEDVPSSVSEFAPEVPVPQAQDAAALDTARTSRPSAATEPSVELTTNCVRALLARSSRSSRSSRQSLGASVFDDPTCTMQLAKDEIMAMFGAPLPGFDDVPMATSSTGQPAAAGPTGLSEAASQGRAAAPSLYSHGGLPTSAIGVTSAAARGDDSEPLGGVFGGFDIYEDTDVCME